MEIRKADSKGRVTGLEGGRHYKIDRLESGVVILSPTGIKEPAVIYASGGVVSHPSPESAENILFALRNGPVYSKGEQ